MSSIITRNLAFSLRNRSSSASCVCRGSVHLKEVSAMDGDFDGETF